MTRVSMAQIFSLLVSLLLVTACAPAPVTPGPTTRVAPTAAASASAPASLAASPASASPAPKPAEAGSPAVARVLETVQVGYLNSASDAGILIGQEKGYFRDRGLDVQLQRFDTGAAMTPGLANGQLDIGAGSPSAGLYNAVARNITIKIVADKGSDRKSFGYQGIAIRKDLEAQIKDYPDLKGRKIGVTGTGGTSPELVLAEALRKGGLTMKDIDVVAVAYPDLNVALKSGALDGAVHFEPLFTVGVKQGISVDWKRADEIYPNHQSAVVMYSGTFADRKVDVARRWMIAYLEGVRYYNDAFVKNQNKDEVIGILARATGTSADVLGQVVPSGLNPDGYVNTEGLTADVRTLTTDFAVVTQPVDVRTVIDNSFVDYALQTIGKYTP